MWDTGCYNAVGDLGMGLRRRIVQYGRIGTTRNVGIGSNLKPVQRRLKSGHE